MTTNLVELSLDRETLKLSRDEEIKRTSRAVKAIMREMAGEVKTIWRSRILAAGFSDRLAKAVRDETYPKSGDSLDPASIVFVRPGKLTGRGAAAIIDSFVKGATLSPRNGRYLWIPADDCPRKRSGQAMGPEEVEARYGRDLRIIKPSERGGARYGGGQQAVFYAVLDGIVSRKSTGRYRKASERELTRRSSSLASVVMFTLVLKVKMPKRLSLDDAPVRVIQSAQQRLDVKLKGGRDG